VASKQIQPAANMPGPDLTEARHLVTRSANCRTLVLGAGGDGRLRLLDVAGAAQSRLLPLMQRPGGGGARQRGPGGAQGHMYTDEVLRRENLSF
jgi:hypothetical protein